MTTKIRKGVSLLFIVLVVSAGATGPVSAALFQDCSVEDSLVSALLRGVLSPNADGECRFNPDDGDPSNTNRADLLAGSLSLEASGDQHRTAVENHLQDTRGAAATEAKIAVIESLNNNSTRTEAKQAARDAVHDYYSVIETNVLADYESKVDYAQYVSDAERIELGQNTGWVYINASYPTTAYTWHYNNTNYDDQILRDNDTVIENYTLLNGTVVDVTAFPLQWIDSGGTTASPDYLYPKSPDITYGAAAEGDKFYYSPPFVKVTGPSGGESQLIYFNNYSYTLDDIDAQSTYFDNNIDVYVDGIYDYYNAGQLDASDVLNPTDLMTRAATGYNDTGSYSFAAIELASLGYAGDLNTSHTVTVVATNTSYDGTLFYANDPATGASFTTGETVDPANYTGSFVFAWQGANDSGIIDLTTPFVIDSATNTKTGEPVNVTTTETYVKEITTASELEQELEELRKLRAELEAAETSAGSTGSGSGWTANKIVIGLVALAAVAMYANKGN